MPMTIVAPQYEEPTQVRSEPPIYTTDWIKVAPRRRYAKSQTGPTPTIYGGVPVWEMTQSNGRTVRIAREAYSGLKPRGVTSSFLLGTTRVHAVPISKVVGSFHVRRAGDYKIPDSWYEMETN